MALQLYKSIGVVAVHIQRISIHLQIKVLVSGLCMRNKRTFSDTQGPLAFSDTHGPMAPDTLISLEV